MQDNKRHRRTQRGRQGGSEVRKEGDQVREEARKREVRRHDVEEEER